MSWQAVAVGAGSSDELIVSGGADAVLCIWRDATQSMLEEASHQQTARTEASQALANALQVRSLLCEMMAGLYMTQTVTRLQSPFCAVPLNTCDLSSA